MWHLRLKLSVSILVAPQSNWPWHSHGCTNRFSGNQPFLPWSWKCKMGVSPIVTFQTRPFYTSMIEERVDTLFNLLLLPNCSNQPWIKRWLGSTEVHLKERVNLILHSSKLEVYQHITMKLAQLCMKKSSPNKGVKPWESKEVIPMDTKIRPKKNILKQERRLKLFVSIFWYHSETCLIAASEGAWVGT